jgi:hypothetical protein
VNILKRYVLLGVGLGVALGISLSFSPVVDASRNASGTYSLPSGNPVVTGTTITSSWANTTLSDLGSEVTNSLDRNGKGGMLAPLRGVDGSSSAPAISWTSETGSGLYRAGSGDIRMQVASANVQKWSATTATFPLAVAITGNATTAAGITATQSTTNGHGVNSTGNGTGHGLRGTGGSSDGYGVLGIGGATNGVGVVGQGTGAGAGASFAAGTAATGGTRRNALSLSNGDLSLSGVTDADPTTGFTEVLTTMNIVKAWGNLTGATPTVNTGFNISSVSCGTNRYTVNMADDMISSTGYAVAVTSHNETVTCTAPASLRAAGSFQIHCNAYDGSPINLCGGSYGVDFIVMGRQ